MSTEKDKTTSDEQRINPRITDIDIGIRTLRKIFIYPLAIHGQLELKNLIVEALQAFLFETNGDGDIVQKEDDQLVEFIVNLITANLKKILKLVLDEEEDVEEVIKDMDNYQGTLIAKTIYEVNFEGPGKNLKGLIEGVKHLFPSKRPLPPSLNNIQVTDLKTSTENPIKKEE